MSENRKTINNRFKKESLVAVSGGECQRCGYKASMAALDFHHLIESEKSFALSDGYSFSLRKLFEEMKKCVCLCANCHRELHADCFDNSTLRIIFNEELASEILEKTEIKSKEFNNCVDCNKQLSNNIAERCPKCASKNQRTVLRPDRDELKTMIRTMAFSRIGEKYSVADNTIRKWCDAESLPRSKRIINEISDEDWLLI